MFYDLAPSLVLQLCLSTCSVMEDHYGSKLRVWLTFQVIFCSLSGFALCLDLNPRVLFLLALRDCCINRERPCLGWFLAGPFFNVFSMLWKANSPGRKSRQETDCVAKWEKSSDKDTSHVGLTPIHNTSFYLYYLFRDDLFWNTVTFWGTVG